MSQLSSDDFEKQVSWLAERNKIAADVLQNPNCTQRLLQVNLAHLQRLHPKLQRDKTYKPTGNYEFNFIQRIADVVDTAKEYKIELQGYLEEMGQAE